MDDSLLWRHLREAVAADDLIVDGERCADYSEDICGGDAVAAAVARPRDLEALSHVVASATGLGYAIVPRGSGHSYTGGVVPDRERCLVVDLTGLDRVLEVDEVDRWVRVEAGCSWAHLLDVLAPRHLRTPFFGPLSGYRATIGGALSQSAAFFGSAMHGFSEQSVLGLTVVLADGTVLRTGVGTDEKPHPHASGPDFGSLFLGDCGAFGVKAEAVMRLRKAPASEQFASFEFDGMEAMLKAQIGLAGVDGVAECFGFDPQAHANLARGGFNLLEGARIVADVARGKGSPGARMERVARFLKLGHRSVAELRYSLHLCVEGENDAHAIERLAHAAELVIDSGGTPIPDTIPRVTRSRPFRPIKALLGPDGERWLTLHGVLRLSEACAAWRKVRAILDAERVRRAEHELTVSLLTVTSGNAIVVEPHLFWPDSLGRFHRRHVTGEQLRRYAARPARMEARTFAHELRAALGDALRAAGAEHLQIGRYYPYAERLDPTRRRLLQTLKTAFDPDGLMNPGVLLPPGVSR